MIASMRCLGYAFGTTILLALGAAGTAVGSAAASHEFSVDPYAKALTSYVDDKGMVDYRGLKADHAALDDFTASIAHLDPKVYEGWSERQKIAFWINVYNALTLKAIIDHYPIQASYLKSLIYPQNSIRQIPGVWDKLSFPVMGRNMTLDHIEHAMLRAGFDEPRIHVALVCGAKGCPPLEK